MRAAAWEAAALCAVWVTRVLQDPVAVADAVAGEEVLHDCLQVRLHSIHVPPGAALDGHLDAILLQPDLVGLAGPAASPLRLHGCQLELPRRCHREAAGAQAVVGHAEGGFQTSCLRLSQGLQLREDVLRLRSDGVAGSLADQVLQLLREPH